MTRLPKPTADAAAHQQKFERYLTEKLQGRSITFEQFMQMALYEPGFGYYAAGSHKLGAKGDFITAPELHPIFGYTLAQAISPTLAGLPEKNILEFGPGSGQLALDILTALPELPDHYYFLEISPDLRARQQDLLKSKAPHLWDRCIWLDTLPKQFCGVILANEVLDAMPVQSFFYQNKFLQEHHVMEKSGKLELILAPPTATLQKAFASIQPLLSSDLAYQSEISTLIPAWISSIADILTQGIILLIDYGFPRSVYYHPDRSMGTIMCHYQHHAHTDPLILLGLQDITAHVDFTLVAESADAAGLEVLGFDTQGGFLLQNHITDFIGHFEPLKAKQALKLLTMPHEMGELFKVMTLGRQVALPNWCHHSDFLHTL